MTSGFSRSRRKVKLLLRIRVRELLLSLERKELEFENEEFNHAHPRESGCNYAGRRCRWCWRQIIRCHADLPSTALMDFDRCKVAPELVRATVLTSRRNRRTPFSVFPEAIAIGTYRMRR